MKIYLAGPINGCSDDETLDWRSAARVRLEAAGHEVCDPADRDFRGSEAANARELVAADKRDIAVCDLLLANAWKVSVGTSMEVLFASMLGIRIIVVSPDNPSPWLIAHATWIAKSMDEALRLVRA